MCVLWHVAVIMLCEMFKVQRSLQYHTLAMSFCHLDLQLLMTLFLLMKSNSCWLF